MRGRTITETIDVYAVKIGLLRCWAQCSAGATKKVLLNRRLAGLLHESLIPDGDAFRLVQRDNVHFFTETRLLACQSPSEFGIEARRPQHNNDVD